MLYLSLETGVYKGYPDQIYHGINLPLFIFFHGDCCFTFEEINKYIKKNNNHQVIWKIPESAPESRSVLTLHVFFPGPCLAPSMSFVKTAWEFVEQPCKQTWWKQHPKVKVSFSYSLFKTMEIRLSSCGLAPPLFPLESICKWPAGCFEYRVRPRPPLKSIIFVCSSERLCKLANCRQRRWSSLDVLWILVSLDRCSNADTLCVTCQCTAAPAAWSYLRLGFKVDV